MFLSQTQSDSGVLFEMVCKNHENENATIIFPAAV
jgi:hypothetical protein